MGIEDNKAIVRRLLDEAWNKKRVVSAMAVTAPGYVSHSNGGPGMNAEATRQAVEAAIAGFPDIQASIVQLIGEGDLVAARVVFTGTHRGTFTFPTVGTLPPTGRVVQFEATVFFRLAEGKVAEQWRDSDIGWTRGLA